MILDEGLDNSSILDNEYNNYKDIVFFLCNIDEQPIELKKLNEPDEIDQNYKNIHDISSEFYEGFGHDIFDEKYK